MGRGAGVGGRGGLELTSPPLPSEGIPRMKDKKHIYIQTDSPGPRNSAVLSGRELKALASLPLAAAPGPPPTPQPRRHGTWASGWGHLPSPCPLQALWVSGSGSCQPQGHWALHCPSQENLASSAFGPPLETQTAHGNGPLQAASQAAPLHLLARALRHASPAMRRHTGLRAQSWSTPAPDWRCLFLKGRGKCHPTGPRVPAGCSPTSGSLTACRTPARQERLGSLQNWWHQFKTTTLKKEMTWLFYPMSN